MQFTWIEWSFIFFVVFNLVSLVILRPKIKQIVLSILGIFIVGGIITLVGLFQVWLSPSGLSKPAGSSTDHFLYCGKADAPPFYNKFYKCSPRMELKLGKLSNEQRHMLNFFFNLGATSNSLAIFYILIKIKTRKEKASTQK